MSGAVSHHRRSVARQGLLSALSTELGGLLGSSLLGRLADERLVDVGDDTTSSDSSLNEGIEFFISADSELDVTGLDTLDLEVLGGVSGQLEEFGTQVLEDSSTVDSGGGSDALLVVHTLLEETVDTTNGELKTSACGTRNGLLGVSITLGLALATGLAAFALAFASLSGLEQW